jgi:PAS domain S-box-containing protein
MMRKHVAETTGGWHREACEDILCSEMQAGVKAADSRASLRTRTRPEMKAPLLDNEPERLEALRRYGILDTLPERDFDDLTSLAAQICETPMALVSLVDADRQWFKAKIGVEATETSRDLAFCAHAILQSDLMVVPDARVDERFSSHPYVAGPPYIRFYAGAPLMTPDGHALGTLCVVDLVPHALKHGQCEALRALGRQVVAQLELRRTRAELESALQKSEERWRAVFDRSAIGVALSDETGRFLAVNRAYEKMLGYTETELLQLSFFDITPEEFRQPNRSLAVEMWAGNRRQYELEKPYRRKDGVLIWVRLHASLVPGSGGAPRLALALCEDITERKRAEEALREAESRLADVTRLTTMGALAASIAHEVNQPLAAIVTNGAACLRMLSVASPDLNEVCEAVEDIIRDGKRASEVIAGVRALFRKQQAQRTLLAVNPIIQEALVLTGGTAERHGVSLHSSLADALPLVLGDPVQLQQVVLNLVANGIDAMSSITGRARELGVTSGRQGANGVLVSVRDSGIGFDRTHSDRLFDAFYTTKPGGIGMGLAISRSIIEAHGGQLWGSPNEGPGATFQFSLPAALRDRS